MSDEEEVKKPNPTLIRDNDWFRLWPPVHESLPIILDNDFIISSVHFECADCGAIIPEGQGLRGKFHKVAGGDYRLTAFGFCYGCNLLTPVLSHFRQTHNGECYIQNIKRVDPVPVEGAKIIPFGKESLNELKKRNKELGRRMKNVKESKN